MNYHPNWDPGWYKIRQLFKMKITSQWRSLLSYYSTINVPLTNSSTHWPLYPSVELNYSQTLLTLTSFSLAKLGSLLRQLTISEQVIKTVAPDANSRNATLVAITDQRRTYPPFLLATYRLLARGEAEGCRERRATLLDRILRSMK